VTYPLSLRGLAGLLAVVLALAAPAWAETPVPSSHRLLEPGLRLAATAGGVPEVALTLDACMGKVDHRILDMLVAERIPATIFVTGRWLKRNPAALAVMLSHPDLFEIEDHGANHVPAVDRPVDLDGIPAAGSPDAVAAEVAGGAAAIVAAGAPKPGWFRGATAKYSTQSIAQIEAMGFRIAGFSVNGDGGALLGQAATARRIAAATDGDVIIAHINQPDHSAGAGVVAGVLALKARGVRFVLLRDRDEATTAGH
jgi:peptidoglycan/xylan/chitin deacetylase (PgdA/CDA1 family)